MRKYREEKINLSKTDLRRLALETRRNNPDLNKIHSQISQVGDSDLTNSSVPLGIVRDKSGKLIVSFLFTLAPLSSFRIIEGGFPQGFPPENTFAVRVKRVGVREFDVKYDSLHAELWNEIVTQRKRRYKAYSPNPKRFRVAPGAN